jgi:hypothetical protein
MNALRLFFAASVVLATALSLVPPASAGPLECGNTGPSHRLCPLLIEEPNCLQSHPATRWATDCRGVVNHAADLSLCYLNHILTPLYWVYNCI